MLSLDLFDSKYERRLHEGAVDDLEQHRIDILNDRMQELLARARSASPEMKASLKQQFEKIKAERDSYYKIREGSVTQTGTGLKHRSTGAYGGGKDLARGIEFGKQKDAMDLTNLNKDLTKRLERSMGIDFDRDTTDEAGIPGNIPTEKIPGKEELLKGRGRTYYEGQKKNSESPLNQRLDRLKVQARREFPQVDSDTEALLLKLLDKEASDDRANRQTDTRQDAELRRNFSLDREQEDEIEDLQAQLPVKEAQTDYQKRRQREKDIDAGRPVTKQRQPRMTDYQKKRAQQKKEMELGEHGGGIGPRQHWQDLMQEEELIEGIKDASAATAVIACLLTGGSLTGCATAPQKTSAQQVLKTGQDLGRTVQTAQRITRAGVEAEVNQEIRNLLRGIGGRPEELNNSNILRIWRKIKGAPPVQPEPQAPEYGPAEPVKRMPHRESRTIHEDNASGAAEQAILKRIMVAHTDLLQQYGPQKVMQAAEEVAYNVGDLGEIGTSDVSGWVKQVQQILGATA